MRALGATMRRRALGYVLSVTVVVALAGSAGMYAFERDVPGSALADFGSALWWTSMVLATMGSEYWPRSAEGRILCLLLAVYAFAVFGYITASLASYFVGRDAERPDAEVAGQASNDQLRDELEALRAELRNVLAVIRPDPPSPRGEG
jgi:voltage-gated potassium channel